MADALTLAIPDPYIYLPTDPATFLPAYPGTILPYDFYWFTDWFTFALLSPMNMPFDFNFNFF